MKRILLTLLVIVFFTPFVRGQTELKPISKEEINAQRDSIIKSQKSAIQEKIKSTPTSTTNTNSNLQPEITNNASSNAPYVANNIAPYDIFVSGASYFNNVDITRSINLQVIIRQNKWGIGGLFTRAKGFYGPDSLRYRSTVTEYGGYLQYLAVVRNTSFTRLVWNAGMKEQVEKGVVNFYQRNQTDRIFFTSLFFDATNRRKNKFYSTLTFVLAYQVAFSTSLNSYFKNIVLVEKPANRESFYTEIRGKVLSFRFAEGGYLVLGLTGNNIYSAEGRKNWLGGGGYAEIYYFGTLLSGSVGGHFPTHKIPKETGYNSVDVTLNVGQMLRLMF